MKLLRYSLIMFIFMILCSFLADYSERHLKISAGIANWSFGMIAGIGIGASVATYQFKRKGV